MTTASSYRFRKATASDIALLNHWECQLHVAEWWASVTPYESADFDDNPRLSLWIVEQHGRPFAFMQDYDVHGWGEDHHFFYLPKGSRGVDQFIGEADMLGQGHGSAFMRQHMDLLFASGVPVIGTDPHPDNARAIAVYRKLGFDVVGDPQSTQWGDIVRMEARNPRLQPI